MKDIIQLEGQEYHSHRVLCKRFGVDAKTIKNWVANGNLPQPVRLGRRTYFDLGAVERRALATAQL